MRNKIPGGFTIIPSIDFLRKIKLPTWRKVNAGFSKRSARANNLSIKHGGNKAINLAGKVFNPAYISNFGLAIFSGLQRLWKSGFLKTKRFQFILLPFLIVLLIGGYGYYWYNFKLGSYFTATLTYTFKNINESKVVSITGEDAAKFGKVELVAEEATTSSTSATGEKVTGNKAAGLITIFNSTTTVKTIPRGTVFSCFSGSCSSLNYILESDLNIIPGTTQKVPVMASDIGDNYNVSPGSGRFRVSNYNPETEVIASNIDAINGGTPKNTLKVVKKEDIAKAENEGMKALQEVLDTKIKNNPQNKDYLINSKSIRIEKVSSEVDTKEGNETDIVNVTVNAKGKVDAFPKGNIDQLAEQMKKDLTPQGYSLDTKLTETSIEIQNATKDKVDVVIKLVSVARPDIDLEKVKSELAGKKYSTSEKVLTSIPNVNLTSRSYQPQTLPQYFWTIPGNIEKIDIKLVAKAEDAK